MGFQKFLIKFSVLYTFVLVTFPSFALSHADKGDRLNWHSKSIQQTVSDLRFGAPPSRTLILMFDSNKNAKAFQPTANFKVIRAWSNYVVIKSRLTLSAKITRPLESRNDITHISIDRIISSLNHESGLACDPSSSDELNGLKDDVMQMADAVSLCSLQNMCSQSQVSSDWDLQSANLDLMQMELKKLKVDLAAKPIAVVDSPVDGNSLSHISRNVTQALEAGAPTKSDENGHGTFVASRILAASPNAAITSFPVGDRDGRAEASRIGQMVQQACESGHRVINLSMGTTTMGVPLDLGVELPNLGDFLKTRGCILVQASGNEHDQGNLLHRPELSPFFLIGSLDVTGDKSEFSNAAQMYAPGGEVAGILPEGSEILKSVQSNKTRMCDGNRRLLPGTSFSAPLVAAVTGAVFAVLDQSTAFRKLSPSDQAQVVKEVVLRSSKNKGKMKVLDGFRATLMARALVEKSKGDQDNSFPAPAEFSNIMLSSKRVADLERSQLPRCSQIQSNCIGRSDCFQSKRQLLALCDSCGSGENSILADLYLTALNSGDFELAQTFAADLGEQTTNKLSAKANFWALKNRIEGIGEIESLSKFVSTTLSTVERPPEFDDGMHVRIRKEIISRDRSLPIESHLDYLMTLESSSKWMDRKAFAQKVWTQDKNKLDDRSLAALIHWSLADTSGPSSSPLISQILQHPQASEYSLRVGAAYLKKIDSRKDAKVAALAILNHAKSDDASLSILAASLAKSKLTMGDREEIWNLLQTSPKAGKITALRTLQNLSQMVSDPRKRESELRVINKKLEDLKLTIEEKMAFGAVAAAQAVRLPGNASVQLFSQIIQDTKVDEGSRYGLASAIINESPNPLEMLKVLAQSSAGYKKEPMSGLETFVLMQSERLTTMQKREFLASLSLSELPPRFILEAHSSKLSPSDQKALLSIYEAP
jgi:hypothetical protein